MHRYLITGVSGFVARHFIERIEQAGTNAAILGVDKNLPEYPYKHGFNALDLQDKAAVSEMIRDFQPTRIAHFASFSSVARSWENPSAAFLNNTNIFLNLLEAIRNEGIKCRVLSVGSSEEYGNVDPGQIPIDEDKPLRPESPYAVARVAQEQLSALYAKAFGLDIIMTRSFNHLGPGQKTDFVVPSLVRQFLDAKASVAQILVGDVSIIRDFLDVRDVVEAYLGLFEAGVSGEVYNVCSGKGVTIEQVIKLLSSIMNQEYSLSVDPKRIRPSDNKIIIGSNLKLSTAICWAPRISLLDSLSDVCSEMRGR